MRKDAESHEEEDKKKKEAIELKNQAETLIHTAEKTMKDAGDKIKPKDKRPVEDSILAVKGALESDPSELKSKIEDLQSKLSEMGAHLYQNEGPEQNPEEDKSDEKNENSSDDQDQSAADKGKES